MIKRAIKVFLVLAGLFSANFISAQVIINEVAWMGTENSANDEWIELYNATKQDIDLNDWILQAEDGSPEIQLVGVILAQGFYLLERTDDNTVPDVLADQLYTGALKNTGEHLQLYDKQGELIDEVNCSSGWLAGDNSSKQTMERIRSQAPLEPKEPGSFWQNSQNPGGTPKAKNNANDTDNIIQTTVQNLLSGTTTSVSKQSEAQPPKVKAEQAPQEEVPQARPVIAYPDGIVINEIMPSPEGPDAEQEWIELYNKNNFVVDVSAWQIKDTIGKTKTYIFPENTKILAFGFLLLMRPETRITLNNDGDTLKILHPDAKITDTATYPKAPRGQSYNRLGPKWQWSNVSTPEAKNIIPAPPAPATTQSTQIKADSVPNTVSSTSTDIAATAAISKAFEQTENKNNKQPWLVIFIAIILSLFSGAVILFLKRKLKTERSL